MSTASTSSRPPAPRWTVLCDFDGTVSPTDVTDSLLDRFAAQGWQALERDWEAGRIGSRACMAGQVALLDCSRDELDAHLARIDIDPRFEDFVADVQAAGSAIEIVSDGLDVAIFSILARTSLRGLPVFASRLVQVGARRWKLEFPQAREGCASAGATCKCARGRVAPDRPVLMVGDGASDFCVAAASDMTFARGKLLARCEREGLAHRPVADFAEAIAAWHDLVAEPRARLAPIHEQEAAR